MKPVVIDVRDPFEYDQGHVAGALNIPPEALMQGAEALRNIPKDTPIVVYCRTGTRSNAAMHILEGLGYTNLKNGINRERVEVEYNL